MSRRSRWDDRPSSGRARKHLARLRKAGVTPTMIWERIGIPPATLRAIASGRARTIDPDRETAILSVLPALAPRTGLGGRVRVIGAKRRLMALMAASWPQEELTARLGFSAKHVLRSDRVWVSQEVHDAVVALYDRLRDTSGPSVRASCWSLARGGATPLDWAGIDMDDPDAAPATSTAHADEAIELICGRVPVEEAAARCGVQVDSVMTQLRRRARRDGAGSAMAALHAQVTTARAEASYDRRRRAVAS